MDGPGNRETRIRTSNQVAKSDSLKPSGRVGGARFEEVPGGPEKFTGSVSVLDFNDRIQ